MPVRFARSFPGGAAATTGGAACAPAGAAGAGAGAAGGTAASTAGAPCCGATGRTAAAPSLAAPRFFGAPARSTFRKMVAIEASGQTSDESSRGPLKVLSQPFLGESPDKTHASQAASPR